MRELAACAATHDRISLLRPRRAQMEPAPAPLLRKEERVRTSRALSSVLRHRATELGLAILPGGYVRVDELLALPRFRRVTREQLREVGRASALLHDAIPHARLQVVAMDDKERYHLVTSDAGDLLIRANQGHSMVRRLHVRRGCGCGNCWGSPSAAVRPPSSRVARCLVRRLWWRTRGCWSSLPTPMSCPSACMERIAQHGTVFGAFGPSQRPLCTCTHAGSERSVSGLSRMRRNHVHFATSADASRVRVCAYAVNSAHMAASHDEAPRR